MVGTLYIKKGAIENSNTPQKKGIVTVNGNPSTDFYGDLLKSIENQSGLIF